MRSYRDYAISESPTWRSIDNHLPHLTSEILRKIHSFLSCFQSLDPNHQERIRHSIRKNECIRFVLHSNNLELSGTQAEGDTRTACEQYWKDRDATAASRDQRKSMNMLSALERMYEISSEMRLDPCDDHERLFLTVDTILDLHRTLGSDIMDGAGVFREASSGPHGYDYVYLDHHLVQDHLGCLVDEHNRLCASMAASGKLHSLEERIKLASWFAFEFMDIHPFSNGNGRLGRLLCAWHFLDILPAPLVFRNDRDCYLQSLVDGRASVPHCPSVFAAFVVESMYLSCERYGMSCCSPRQSPQNLIFRDFRAPFALRWVGGVRRGAGGPLFFVKARQKLF